MYSLPKCFILFCLYTVTILDSQVHTYLYAYYALLTHTKFRFQDKIYTINVEIDHICIALFYYMALAYTKCSCINICLHQKL